MRNLALHAAAAVFGWLLTAERLEGLARVGYAARGVVYLLVGWLAAASAFSESRPPSIGGALSAVSELPAGWLLVAAISAGLFSYALWRLVQAALDLNGKGWDGKGLLRRGGMLVDALVHAGFGFLAGAVALGWTGLIAGEWALGEVAAELALDWPLGHWMLALAGLGAVATGGVQVAKARRTAFEDIRAGRRETALVRVTGRIGLAARGLIFASIGVLCLVAAWRAEDTTAAGGLRAGLRALTALPLGNGVLLAVSAGLALFGLFSLLKGWNHRRPEP
jgi:hypothetical protein